MKLPLARVSVDYEIQSRVSLCAKTVDEYAALYAAKTKMPPVVVFHDTDDNYWLADGFHRWAAANQAKMAKIECDVRDGTRRDAILYSLGANSTHGLRRTNADKRKAVETVLADEEWSKFSARKIAEICGVSNRFVADIQDEMSAVNGSHLPSTKVGADGKSYPAKNPRAEGHETTNGNAQRRYVQGDLENQNSSENDWSQEGVSDEPSVQRNAKNDPQWDDVEVAEETSTPAPTVEQTTDRALPNSLTGFREQIREWQNEMHLGKKRSIALADAMKRIAGEFHLAKGLQWGWLESKRKEIETHFASIVRLNTALHTDLERIHDVLEAHLPAFSCRHCKGKGCDHCCKTGYVSKYQVNAGGM